MTHLYQAFTFPSQHWQRTNSVNSQGTFVYKMSTSPKESNIKQTSTEHTTNIHKTLQHGLYMNTVSNRCNNICSVSIICFPVKV